MGKQKLTIAIASDHAGFDLKEGIKTYLCGKNYNMLDCGTFSKETVDYAKFAFALAKKVSQETCTFGILVAGGGIGSARVANKVKGVRAALCYDIVTARNAREHNDANVLILGVGQIASPLAKQIVDVFLATQCTVERISNASNGHSEPQTIAKFIDHTLLKPEATPEQIKKLCAEAREYSFATVCINPTYVALAAKELAGSTVGVCTVVGFPLGSHISEIKGLEARRAICDGATEIDMVINIGALKGFDDDLVYKDIRMVVEACEDGGAICKGIIEAALLNDDEKIRVCELAKRARANYVKTSTGFGPGGATEKDVALMNKIVKNSGIGIKAAGGIKSYEDAAKMINAGATRIGASAGIKIVQEAAPVTKSK